MKSYNGILSVILLFTLMREPVIGKNTDTKKNTQEDEDFPHNKSKLNICRRTAKLGDKFHNTIAVTFIIHAFITCMLMDYIILQRTTHIIVVRKSPHIIVNV